MKAVYLIWLCVWYSMACGEARPRLPSEDGPVSVVVFNRCSEEAYVFRELKLHKQVDDYRQAPNLLEYYHGGLEPGASILLGEDDITPESFLHVTVIRPRTVHDVQDMVALTSEQPFYFESGTYILWIGNEVMRLKRSQDSLW